LLLALALAGGYLVYLGELVYGGALLLAAYLLNLLFVWRKR